MMERSSAKIDPLLEPLLPNVSEEQADDILSELIAVHAEPLIKGIIHYKLHFSSHGGNQRAEADDIYQEVLVRLLGEVARLRSEPEKHPIADLRG